MLTPDELAAARADIAGLMPDTCTVLRPTETPDGAGGRTRAWEPALTCQGRIGPVSAEEGSVVGARVTEAALYRITVPWDADVRPTDRIQVDGRVFDVRAVLRRGAWEMAARAVCVEVT